MEGNLGLLQHQRGLYAEAVQLFLHSIGLLAADDPNRAQKISFTRINLAQAYLALFDFKAALVTLQDSIMDYADILSYIRDYANDIAKQINTAYAQTLAGALTLRIVQKDANAHEAIPVLLEELDRWIVQGNQDVITFVVLREEAGYFQHSGATVLARWYGERALTMSERFAGDELRPAIEVLLSAVGG